MSLILDALKKLDRERQTRDPGVVVVGSVPWRTKEASRRALFLLGLLAVALAAGAGTFWWRLSRPSGAPATGTASRAASPPGLQAPLRAEAPPAPSRPDTTTPLPGPAAPSEPALAEPTATARAAASGTTPRSRQLVLPPTVGSAPDTGSGTEGSEEAPPDAEGAEPAAEAEEAHSPPGPRLNAISRRDGQPIAIIDGRLVREGDTFEGIRVLRIGETEVEIEVRGERRTLRF